MALWDRDSWEGILVSPDLMNLQEIEAVVVCSTCFLKKKLNKSTTDAESLRMVIQNRNFPRETEKEKSSQRFETFDVDLHVIEFFVLFPEKEYCPHFIVSIPIRQRDEVPIKKYEDLREGIEFIRRKNEEGGGEPYTITTGWRRWRAEQKRWATTGRSNDLFIWPVHWEKLMTVFGHSAEFGKVEGDTIVFQSCSLCRGEIKISAGKNSKECQCST